jgi:hypothetical protein
MNCWLLMNVNCRCLPARWWHTCQCKYKKNLPVDNHESSRYVKAFMAVWVTHKKGESCNNGAETSVFMFTWTVHVFCERNVGARNIPRTAHTLLGPSSGSGDQPWTLLLVRLLVNDTSPYWRGILLLSLCLTPSVRFYFLLLPPIRPSPHLQKQHPADHLAGHTGIPVVGMSEDTVGVSWLSFQGPRRVNGRTPVFVLVN